MKYLMPFLKKKKFNISQEVKSQLIFLYHFFYLFILDIEFVFPQKTIIENGELLKNNYLLEI